MAEKPSPVQLAALDELSHSHFVYSVAGWGPPGRRGIGAFSTQTVAALARQGWARFKHRGTRRATLAITDDGRRVLAARGDGDG